MSFLELAIKLKQVITILDETRPEDSAIIAKETAALVRNRVQNEKVDEDGASFDAYSQAVVPQWMLYSSATSDGAIERLKEGEWFQSYEDLKVANNQPIDAKNYTNTGEMWRNTGITSIESNGSSTTVTIGGQTERAANIHAWTLERDDVTLIAPNESEVQFLLDAHTERVLGAINDVFN